MITPAVETANPFTKGIEMPDIKWVATSLVSLVVAIMVIALVAVPVVEDMGGEITRYGGDNPGYANRYTDMHGQAIDFTWNGGVSTLNGNTIPNGVPAIVSDKILLRTSANSFYIYDFVGEKMQILRNTTLHLTITAAGAWTATVGDSTWGSGTGVSKLLVISEKGAIGQYNSAPVKASDGQTIYLAHWDATGGNGPIRFIECTDGTVGTQWFTQFTFTGYDSATGEATLIEGYETTYTVNYSLNSEQGVGTYSGVTSAFNDTTSTDIQYFAPINFDGATVSGDGGINAALIGIIPLLLFIVAIMIAVRIMRDA